MYTSKGSDHKFARGDHPVELLKSSILTPSLAAGIFNYKYVDAMPINRISEEFRRNDVEISRQVMAGWMIKLADRYIRIIYNEMKKHILTSKLIHCDETPFKLVNDGRSPNSKSGYIIHYPSTTHHRYSSMNISSPERLIIQENSSRIIKAF